MMVVVAMGTMVILVMIDRMRFVGISIIIAMSVIAFVVVRIEFLVSGFLLVVVLLLLLHLLLVLLLLLLQLVGFELVDGVCEYISVHGLVGSV